MILLVHSCDSREWLWKHWWSFFEKIPWKIHPYFLTEYKTQEWDGAKAYTYPTKKESFSDQLITALTDYFWEDEYIWYTLDDYWIVDKIDWKLYEQLAIDLKCDALRLQPNVQENSLPYRFAPVTIFPGGDKMLKQRQDSEYHVSCATSIWRREYFLECLKPGLDPWQTEKLTVNPLGDVYFVPELPFWYIDATRRGVLTDKAKELL